MGTRLQAALALKKAQGTSLWKVLTRWPVVAAVVPVFIGVGVGVETT